MNIFPTFHASLLKPWRANDPEYFPSHEYSRPGPILNTDGEEEWPVERILDKRRRGRGWQYLVRWSGYGPEHDEWLPGSEVGNLEAYGAWLEENEPERLPGWRREMELDIPEGEVDSGGEECNLDGYTVTDVTD